MKIALLSPVLSRSAGGIFEIVVGLSSALARAGVNVGVFGPADAFTEADAHRWSATVELYPCSRFGPAAFGYCPSMQAELSDFAPDLVHRHGMWSYSAIVDRSLGKPYVVTPHGMLENWALGQSKVRKMLALRTYEKRSLEAASAVQVNSEAEAEQVRRLGVARPSFVVPNGIDLPNLKKIPPAPRKIMLFLGRLHGKKGLLELIEAWRLACELSPVVRKEWQLRICGWDDGLGSTIKQRISAARLHGEQVYVRGGVYGADKAAELLRADAFVLPSYSEGLPIAVLEAWANRLPVLMTAACNIAVGFESGSAIEIQTETNQLARSLIHFCTLTEAARQRIGDSGRELVRREFSWDGVATTLLKVYKQVLKDRTVPKNAFPEAST